ncbi:MAG: MFS transporter permease [Zoogloea sp.]|nr:MFS transporter permease [Zoogloea sp.]
MPHPQDQLHSIHAMLAAGHRSVHLERHSLLLIGGVGGFVSLVSEWVITTERFPDTTQRALVLLLWLAFWLGGLSLLDHWLTRRARQRRAETLPFAQAQITRAWWMLLSVGSLGSFAMFFYGGGAMIYGLWIVLLGLGIYLFGLFSRPLIEWIGLATILLGVAGLAAGLPYGATHWLAASCFAIGMPLAGWLAARIDHHRLPQRLGALTLWLLLVALPPLLATQLSHAAAPAGPTLAPGDKGIGLGEQVLRLEAGTRVPLRADLESPILASSPQAGLDLVLSLPVEIALRDGQPDGRYRIADGTWHGIRDGVLRLTIDRLTPRLEDGQPVIRAHARFGGAEFEGDKP